MRTIILCTVLTALLILPGAALAVQFVSVDGVADCNGWSSDVEIWFREGATRVELSYVVVLADADGNELQRFEALQELPVTVGPPVPFSFAGTFDATPPAGSIVSAEYHLYDWFTDGYNDMTAGFAAAPDCAPPAGGDEPEPLCTHTARWWQLHRGEWPAAELAVGNEVWDARTLHRVLARPAWGNVRMLLARQLVAAKFNALVNPGADVAADITAADAWLAAHDPLSGSSVRGRDRWRQLRQEASAVRDLVGPLFAFNTHGCSAEAAAAEADQVSDLELVEKALAGEKALPDEPDQVTSFGALKSMYR